MRARFLVVWAVACGGSGDAPPTDGTETDATDATETGGTETDTPPTTEVSVLVEAAAGGTVEAFGATLVIPPGALSADTEITVTATSAAGLPDSATVVGDVLDYGPDGTAFDPPATLTLSADATLAADEALVISRLDGQAWTDLPSTAGGGAVSAEVAHFTSFAARVVVQAPGVYACAPVAGCGGDPSGTWTLVSSCRMSAGELPFTCDVPYVTESDGTSLRTYAGAGTFEVRGTGGGTTTYTHTAPAECLPAGATDCATLYDPLAGTLESLPTCTGDAAVACACSDGPYPGSGTSVQSGTWSVSGTTLTETTPGEVGYVDRVFEFCVDGDTLTIWSDNGSQPWPTVYARTP